MEIKYSGFIALAGRPNVGKSTLINAIVGEKIAIVSPKPQTTRNRIVGIKNIDDKQMVFIDTPGLHAPKTALGDFMVKTANDNIRDTDIVILVVEPKDSIAPIEQRVIDNIKAMGQNSILVINKVDTVKDKPKIMNTISVFTKAHNFDAVVPLSASKNKGVDILVDELLKLIPEGFQYYPEDMVSDQPARVRVAEIIREKMLYCLNDEIPHGIAIDVTSYKERESGDICDISVDIVCERQGHKSIIIGKGGAMLKRIASAARVDIEDMLGMKINLKCWVRVKEDWRDNKYLIRIYGYDDE